MSRIARLKQRYITLRIFVFVTIAVALLFFDHHHDARVEKFRQILARVTTPLQQVASVPVTLWQGATDQFAER